MPVFLYLLPSSGRQCDRALDLVSVGPFFRTGRSVRLCVWRAGTDRGDILTARELDLRWFDSPDPLSDVRGGVGDL